METVKLGKYQYEMEQVENEVKLKRYDTKNKIWVYLNFPKDGEDNSEEFINTLVKLYIDRQLKTV